MKIVDGFAELLNVDENRVRMAKISALSLSDLLALEKQLQRMMEYYDRRINWQNHDTTSRRNYSYWNWYYQFFVDVNYQIEQTIENF